MGNNLFEANLFEDLKNLIIEILYINGKKISQDSRLERDLEIYYADACELLDEYSERFKVDISEFKYDLYFSSEGDRTLSYFFAPINKDLTVRHLQMGIIAGKLNEEVINSLHIKG